MPPDVRNATVDDPSLAAHRKFAAINPWLHVLRIDSAANDGGKGQAGGVEQRADVFEHAPRVHGDIALDHPTGCRIERHLAGDEQELAHPQRRRVGTHRLGCERAGNRLLQAALVTLPERRQRVQTRSFFWTPFRTVRTRRRLGLKRRWVTLCAWLTRLPNWGPLPQTSHR